MVALDGVQVAMTRLIKTLRNSHGQALVEFALLLPLVMLILIGIVEFGRAWQAKQTLTDAAREGARVAVVGNNQLTLDSVQYRVKVMIKGAGFDSSSVVITYPDGCRFATCSPQLNTGDITSVTLTMPHRFVALQRLITLATSGGILQLTSTARMRVE